MNVNSSRSDEIERVSRQLERWRQREDRGRRIPEVLWEAVVKLAREHGVSRIAYALRLDYSSIRRRLDAADPPARTLGARSGGRFVEIPLQSMAAPRTCVLEVEDGRGARLRLELQGLGAEELAGVARAVWSQPR